MMGVAPIAASLTGANGSSSPLSSGNRFGDYGHKLQPIEKFGIKAMSIGFLVDPMQAVIWRGPMVSGALKQFMSDVS